MLHTSRLLHLVRSLPPLLLFASASQANGQVQTLIINVSTGEGRSVREIVVNLCDKCPDKVCANCTKVATFKPAPGMAKFTLSMAQANECGVFLRMEDDRLELVGTVKERDFVNGSANFDVRL